MFGIGGTIFGGISMAKAAKKVKNNLEKRNLDNENWYDRRWNEDETQRATAQRMLATTNRYIRDRNRAAVGQARVMGGEQPRKDDDLYAEVASQIAVAGDRDKANIEQQYINRKESLGDKLNELELKKAGNVSDATRELTKSAGNLAGLF